ncbi:DUF2804 domain-containing protein [Rheinheimera riviphila]|uniref:DUF2804 domain-containing protein n=1 Tax=Rheinheimera riviphila TaxID=1834037 RepID=A0A437R4G7_9GAMM|nr:DUF2804 domain-containing protein [Rheinheimera riviphila]RVU41669.1 DUF2804 domain-containing protein [Rheinheimera riviphila]
MSFCYSPRISQTPQQLIDRSGQPQFGIFEQSVPELNFGQFDYRTVLDKPASQLSRHFAQKQFQFVTVCGDGWLLAVAIADIRYASSGFAYLYQTDHPTFEKGLLLPLQLGCQMSESPIAGVAKLHSGKTSWSIEPGSDHWQLTIDCGPLQARLQFDKNQQPPLALCAPTGYQGFTYTEKNNALAVSGQLSLAGKNFPLEQARAGYDFSAGFMRRQTNWRWASINSVHEGKAFGLNLAAGVNETGLCENAMWFDGDIQHLSPAQFRFDRYNQQSRWQVSTLCDELELEFTPLFCRQEKVQAGLLASNFRQYVGHYQGEIRLRDGQVLKLNQCLGLAEDHYAKW